MIILIFPVLNENGPINLVIKHVFSVSLADAKYLIGWSIPRWCLLLQDKQKAQDVTYGGASYIPTWQKSPILVNTLLTKTITKLLCSSFSQDHIIDK